MYYSGQKSSLLNTHCWKDAAADKDTSGNMSMAKG